VVRRGRILQVVEMRVSRGIAAFLVVLGFGGATALANVIDPSLDCLSEDNERRISGCSAMIETPGLPPEQLSVAYGLRALGYSLKGWFDKAVADYDKAIGLNPDFAAALNNRAWAYYKLGRPQQGVGDVERALELAPGNPYALDTRAHIHQLSGDAAAALSDYELAMRYGGETIVKLYQCGLRSQSLYFGALDGVYSSDVKRALHVCINRKGCDPLPSDEDCKPSVS
jgi:tetratricopeptide (TPR) repeat protein